METTIEGNLILTKDTYFDGDLTVRGHILRENGERFDLKVEGDIECWNIKCNDIDCNDIDCNDINCRNINCWNINCNDIDCNDIDYYAVCFAYNNIKCNAIKGRRNNHKHFVLDGEIIIN